MATRSSTSTRLSPCSILVMADGAIGRPISAMRFDNSLYGNPVAELLRLRIALCPVGPSSFRPAFVVPIFGTIIKNFANSLRCRKLIPTYAALIR